MARLSMPKGRQTIRSAPDNGRGNRRVRLWEIAAQPGTTAARLEGAYLAALTAVDTMEARRKHVETDARLTPAGAKDALQTFVMSELVPTFHKGRIAIRKAQDELAEKKLKLRPPKPDAADAASAIARVAICSWLRELTQAERDRITGAQHLDPQVQRAVLEFPAEMTGVAASHRQLMQENVLRETHGALLDEIEELQDAIEVTTSAVEGARDECRLEVGIFDPGKFNELAAPFEAKVSTPWLRRSKDASGADVVHVVDMERRVQRPATSEEIESGRYFGSFEEYQRETGATS